MILHLFRRTPRSATIASLYGTIVAQARRPVFYQIYGVPDTINGRFEMILLHAVLVLDRLDGAEPALRRLGQGLFDAFCQDMDASMREMGVGDLAVPRKMRRIGEAFYGRQAAYREALAAPDAGALAAALRRTIFADSTQFDDAERLARYARTSAQELAVQDGAALARGELVFPSPEQVAVAG